MSRVAQWPSHRVPSVGPQLFMCVLMLQNSHGPDGKIADVLALMGCSRVSHFVLAGLRCAHRQRHGDLLIVHHHWQHSYRLCACSYSKVPIAPMGKLLTHLL